jgi:hypothetical protein
MEVAGVGIGVVGLAGLVSSCLDVLEKVDTYKTFGSDAQSLSLALRPTSTASASGFRLSALSMAASPTRTTHCLMMRP